MKSVTMQSRGSQLAKLSTSSLQSGTRIAAQRIQTSAVLASPAVEWARFEATMGQVSHASQLTTCSDMDAESALQSICQTAAEVALQARQQIVELHPVPDNKDCTSHALFMLGDDADADFCITSSYEDDSDAALWLQEEIATKSMDEQLPEEDDEWPLATDAAGFVELLRDLSQATLQQPQLWE